LLSSPPPNRTPAVTTPATATPNPAAAAIFPGVMALARLPAAAGAVAGVCPAGAPPSPPSAPKSAPTSDAVRLCGACPSGCEVSAGTISSSGRGVTAGTISWDSQPGNRPGRWPGASGSPETLLPRTCLAEDSADDSVQAALRWAGGSGSVGRWGDSGRISWADGAIEEASREFQPSNRPGRWVGVPGPSAESPLVFPAEGPEDDSVQGVRRCHGGCGRAEACSPSGDTGGVFSRDSQPGKRPGRWAGEPVSVAKLPCRVPCRVADEESVQPARRWSGGSGSVMLG
jgi:hypothetical protein